jgi:hypothetical protein
MFPMRIRMAFVLLAIAANIACSADNQIKGLIKPERSGPKTDIISDILPGALQNDVNTEGYTISSGVGAWAGEITTTTAEGYQIFHTVQGQVVSE